MDGLLRTATDAGRFQNWPATVGILVIVALATFVVGLVRRPAFSQSAPQLVYGGGYPVLGMLRFFSERRNFIRDAARATKSGHFSFYFGKLQVVNVSGIEGRRTFFESRELNMSEGYATLFATTPRMRRDGRGESRLSLNKWFSHTIVAMMRKENFVRNLPQLVADTQGQLASLVARREAESGSAGADTLAGTFDPFVDINRIVYQLTMRTVGADDIAESPELLDKTLSLFEQIESSSSPARIIFPWLPTFGYIKRMSAGLRLFMTFKRIADDRRKSGRRRKDALQYLLDGGESMERIVTFVAGALFAGQINSGVNAAWMLVYLACDPYWYGRIRNEVDEAVHRHRFLPSQSAADVLGSLTVDDWETEFPLIELCLRECIRVQMVGTAFRKNISNKDVPIGKSGEVVPKDAYAVYLIDDVHMNPDIYPDPERWNPGRYLPDRAEDKKAPLSYVGWGTGRHPCLGMRFAKLEVGIIAAMFTATFDFELVDDKGKKVDTAPMPNRNYFAASKPDEEVWIRYTVRQQ